MHTADCTVWPLLHDTCSHHGQGVITKQSHLPGQQQNEAARPHVKKKKGNQSSLYQACIDACRSTTSTGMKPVTVSPPEIADFLTMAELQ